MDQRPNILFIMTDQQRGDALGIEGHPVLQTPNMDQIAASGVRFTKAYTTCPTCIGARRSLLSGQFPPTHGMVGYRDGVEWDAPPTLPGVLRHAGYHTALVGRTMHQSPKAKRYGYDEQTCFKMGGDRDWHTKLMKHAPSEEADYFGGGVMHNDWGGRPWHYHEHLHMTNWTTDEALDFLHHRWDPSCPFFLTVSYAAPHPPLQPPAWYLERYLRTGVDDPVIGDWAQRPANGGLGLNPSADVCDLTGEQLLSTRAAYYGMINHVDDQIRRLLNPVQGVDRMTGHNTIVVFCSDHGEMLGDHYLWRKTVPYEPSARVPLLIRAPQQFGIAPGTVVDEPVCLEDIMPTLLDLAGVDIPGTVEGLSLTPLARGEKREWRESLHIEHAPQHHCMTDGREKFIWFAADGREQFFDLSEDPTECHDLIDDESRADRVELWRQRLIEELADRPEGFVEGGQLVPGRPYSATLPHAGKQD